MKTFWKFADPLLTVALAGCLTASGYPWVGFAWLAIVYLVAVYLVHNLFGMIDTIKAAVDELNGLKSKE